MPATIASDPPKIPLKSNRWPDVAPVSPSNRRDRLWGLVEDRIEQPPALGQILHHRLQALAILMRQTGSRRDRRARGNGTGRSRAAGAVVVADERAGSALLIRLVGCVLRQRRAGLRRAGLPDALHEAHALLAQEPLYAADGVALAVEQMPDTP